jgi:hypothetical protein
VHAEHRPAIPDDVFLITETFTTKRGVKVFAITGSQPQSAREASLASVFEPVYARDCHATHPDDHVMPATVLEPSDVN